MRAQLADRRLDQRVRGRGLAHVAREHDRAAPQLADVGGGVGRHVLVAVAGDVGAGRGERARERGADSGARARDERGEAVETKCITHFCVQRGYFRLASSPEFAAEAGLHVDDAELTVLDLACAPPSSR